MFHEAIPSLRFIPPMLPTLVAEPPEGDGWSHEIKYDGYRTELVIAGREARAFTRNGHDWTEKYRPIVQAAATLPCRSAMIDGEMVVQDEHGRSDFDALRSAITRRPDRLIFYAFDLLHLNGRDHRPQSLMERRADLAELVGAPDPACPIQFSANVIGNGAAMFDAADAMGLEGIVSKKLGSRYRSGLSTAWLKIKCFAEDEFVVIGTEQGVGPTTALVARETDEGLEYAGGAMLTLGAAERDHFWAHAERLKSDRPPLRTGKKAAVWIRPELRVRVRYLKGSDKLRHATVLRLL